MQVTVTQLNNYIKGVVDMDNTLSNIKVVGEITNGKSSYDCWYFSIKDEYSQVDCFAWKNNIVELPYGKQVIVKGNINYSNKYGRLTMNVLSITVIQQGNNDLALQELKKKLQKIGIFDLASKKNIPTLPNKIGIVTSEHGAVIKDIVKVVGRRQPFCNMILYPVHVQGTSASQEIVAGINYFSNSDVDVIIVARGGGSEEDLSVFNQESVVIAIANCTKPLVTAIGHGVDYTLSDMASDLSVVTPSEAGERVTSNCVELIEYVYSNISYMSERIKTQIYTIKTNIISNINTIASVYSAKISDNIAEVKSIINSMSAQAQLCWQRAYNQADKNISLINASSPLNILQKGYAIANKQQLTIRSISQVQVDDDINLQLCDGTIKTKVVEVI